MDRRLILDVVFEKIQYTNEQKEIMYAIEDAKEEWDSANSMFQLVKDPQLIDYAIHKENAAKSKYLFYLAKAKELGICMNLGYTIEKG
ncbi:Protein of unknown function [Clostridium collagenovorans DSM 3089]|uniref:DUF2508 domain-containing protein n=1 Tax=Clostridium collagenovorans DSM 3089 TaxID=1121306 RepID=A0A1M5YL11_9CLOT|nr:YaaL family protein [Clostridium collagenovorans]SHI12223.1 Protein of unknown function [Clostridium collagenovorans DSM 3089]